MVQYNAYTYLDPDEEKTVKEFMTFVKLEI
jgi:hypothetical protein